MLFFQDGKWYTNENDIITNKNENLWIVSKVIDNEKWLEAHGRSGKFLTEIVLSCSVV